MTKAALLTRMLLAGTALGFPGCGPVVPLNPTWKDDVRPLVVARCVRCHDDPVHIDPAINLTIGTMPVTSFDYPADLLPPLPAGLQLLHDKGADYARGEDGARRRMPPPPAAALEDWQIEILEAWGEIDVR